MQKGERKKRPLVAAGNPDPLHSYARSAEFLGGISDRSVKNYVREKKLRPVKIGGRVFIRQSELERFIKAGEQR